MICSVVFSTQRVPLAPKSTSQAKLLSSLRALHRVLCVVRASADVLLCNNQEILGYNHHHSVVTIGKYCVLFLSHLSFSSGFNSSKL